MKNLLAAESSLYRMNKRLLETEIRTILAYAASGDLLVVFMVAVSILLSPPPSHFLGGFLVGGGSHRSPSHSLAFLPHAQPANQQSINILLSSGLVGTLPTTCGKPSLVTNTITAVSSGHSCQITPSTKRIFQSKAAGPDPVVADSRLSV